MSDTTVPFKPLPEDPAELHARLLAAEKLLADAAHHMADIETAPSKDWWKRFFLYNGAHMILTEEGWEPGEGKETYLEQAKEDEMDIAEVILDEVNDPEKKDETVLWGIHITGMDEYTACRDQLHAMNSAADFNAWFAKEPKTENSPHCEAKAVIWPYNQDSWQKSLAEASQP